MPIDKILEEEIGEVDVPYFEPEDPLERGRIQGRNNHIMLLKSRIPQIKERILGEIEKNKVSLINHLPGCTNILNIRKPCICGASLKKEINEVVDTIINTLKGGNK